MRPRSSPMSISPGLGGRARRARSHGAGPPIGWAAGVSSPEPDRAHLPRPRHLPSPAGPRPGARRGREMGPVGGRRRVRLARMKSDAFFAAADALPVASLTDLLGDGGAVVVAPHPDDESLGCGALILEAIADKRPVRIVFVSDGTRSHPTPQLPCVAPSNAAREGSAGRGGDARRGGVRHRVPPPSGRSGSLVRSGGRAGFDGDRQRRRESHARRFSSPAA